VLVNLGLRAAGSSPPAHNHSALSQAGGLASRAIASPVVRRFQVDLPRPRRLAPDRSDATTDYYTIEARAARQEILPGLQTTVWGYNGLYPGPTIEARRGRRGVVRLINSLPEPLSVHHHGGITAPQHDGYAEDILLNGVRQSTLVRPGKTWDYEYPNDQNACTNWYHDHAIHQTAEHVYRGLAGAYFIRDDEELSFNLPQGEFEIPLVLQDKLFDAGGELVYDSNDHAGLEGDVQLVNAAPWPRVPVAARKYRFRLLNGANWRRYDLSLSNGMQWIQLGNESGFLRAPQRVPMIRMFPGERNDVVLDFAALPVGATVTLLNRAKEAIGTPMEQVLRFEVVRTAADDSQIPAALASYEDLTTPAVVSGAAKTREFVFERKNGFYAINGQIWDVNRFDASPRLGTTEIWSFVNKAGGWYHPIHVHLVDFQILDRGEPGKRRPASPWERGRKDVVALGENEQARVVIKWDPATLLGFTGPYMIHCHLVEHEDHDMMTQFQLLPQL
jgi:FtsP/CotA-like multicopper oxidase with cupredoxin domain